MESVKFLRDGDRLHFLHRGVTLAVRDLTLRRAGIGRGQRRRRQGPRRDERPRRRGAGQAGRAVAAGQPVMTLEAMKMEHVHTAGIAGTVSAIDVAEGEQVTTGKIVVEIAAD